MGKKNPIKQLNEMIDKDATEVLTGQLLDEMHENIKTLKGQVGDGTVNAAQIVDTLGVMEHLIQIIISDRKS